MKIEFKLYASLGEYLPVQGRQDNRVTLELADGTAIMAVLEPLGIPPKLVHLVLVNGVYVAPEQRASHALKDGDVLAIWPPIAGG